MPAYFQAVTAPRSRSGFGFAGWCCLAERKPFLLRLQPELMDALNLWARDELRSLNAQIEFLLRDAVRKHRTRKELPATDADSDTRTDDV